RYRSPVCSCGSESDRIMTSATAKISIAASLARIPRTRGRNRCRSHAFHPAIHLAAAQRTRGSRGVGETRESLAHRLVQAPQRVGLHAFFGANAAAGGDGN